MSVCPEKCRKIGMVLPVCSNIDVFGFELINASRLHGDN